MACIDPKVQEQDDWWTQVLSLNLSLDSKSLAWLGRCVRIEDAGTWRKYKYKPHRDNEMGSFLHFQTSPLQMNKRPKSIFEVRPGLMSRGFAGSNGWTWTWTCIANLDSIYDEAHR